MNHLEPVVSEEFSRQYERRKEIIRKGTWNASRKGWEYNGDFAGMTLTQIVVASSFESAFYRVLNRAKRVPALVILGCCRFGS